MNLWKLLYNCLNLLQRCKTRIISNYYSKELHQAIYLQYPCRLIGKDYIIAKGSFSSLSGLRMECLDNYLGHKYLPKLIIGNRVSFNSNCHIGCINSITIGDNVLIGSNVLIIDHGHGDLKLHKELPSYQRPLYSKGSVFIGDNCWIGENVCILPNVKIGENCVIGAGCIVTKDIPANSIAVGNPLRIISSL